MNDTPEQRYINSIKSSEDLRHAAREIQDIEQWLIAEGNALAKASDTAFLRLFRKSTQLEYLQIKNVKYTNYYLEMTGEFEPELHNKLGYEARLVYHFDRPSSKALDLSNFPGVHCKGTRVAKPVVPNGSFEQRVFLSADEWPFIAAHLVFDWLNDADKPNKRLIPSDRYSASYTGIRDILSLSNKTITVAQAESLVQNVHARTFPHMPWHQLGDLANAGVVSEDKATFTEWLCAYSKPVLGNTSTLILPDEVFSL